MDGYTKLFGSILASTIWGESKETKVLWITMLAMADKFGDVQSSIPGLATIARLTVPETEEALSRLSAPDQYSRSKDFEGRRIEAIDGGWHLLNHGKYREKMNVEDRKIKNKEYQRKFRERKKLSASVSESNAGSDKISKVSIPSTSAHAACVREASDDGLPVIQEGMKDWLVTDAEANASNGKPPPAESQAGGARIKPPRKPKNTNGHFVPPTEAEVAEYCRERKNGIDPEAFVDFYASKGWKVGGQKMSDWQAAVRTWEKRSGNGVAAPKKPPRICESEEQFREFQRLHGGE